MVKLYKNLFTRLVFDGIIQLKREKGGDEESNISSVPVRFSFSEFIPKGM